ncbi:sigma-70 family RNA polymerase sigma factor [Saprospira sp. CCB-QB6]|uniref:RNA polymerase sigma factor n=1 Tax=Saprospira sp. CCB-QB6 TaxID=3023936 RepID=UPI00234A9DB5|nr:sigma-70 family RNA polymerase sigma factor [Saprospira sp. CCB-QB6]WCL82194.1 sigma-70 family RNA polymerase sigma factor [Saprospira sp. CCB-QB6]
MRYSNKSTDNELIQGCRKGDRLAQKHLYEKYYGRMYGIAMRYTKNQEEALDILNTSFLKVFTSLDKYQDSNNLAGWIAKIVFNSAIDHVRRNTKYKQVINYNIERDGAVHNGSLQQLQAEDLYRLIQRLPNASRSVFNLYVVDGYKHKEIADMLGISVGTSKWHLANARKELRALLEQQKRYEAAP